MSKHVQVKEAGTGEWLLLTDATVEETHLGHQVTVPASSAFASRLSAAGPRRYLTVIGDMDSPEGALPNLERGVIRTWRPQGDRMLIDIRPAATIEDLQG